jgi:uncharacterized membrane protein YhaH (DUF805 family)
MTEYSEPRSDVDQPLDRPLYGATPLVAVTRMYRNYAVFSGRASRAEFWWPVLLFNGALIVVGIIGGFSSFFGVSTIDGGEVPSAAFLPMATLAFLLIVATLLPLVSVSVRRLHDANLSGLLYFVYAIPWVGGVLALCLAALPPKPEGTRFDTVVARVD